MNVFDLYAKITLDTKDYESKLSSAKTSASGLASKLGSGLQSAASLGGSALKTIGSVAATAVSKAADVAKTVAKVSAAAVGTATAGVVALTKNAVENYAEYQQLVGGVETLFGNSADKIKWYALNAYQTAGMNANEYMDTVTSFSASLLQGLGGDTAKAAEYANTAITDMADNANKMGTSISMIQNAYQGFAKQNYTMLDNLKLGYGGTASEMARLVNASGVLGDAVEVTAETINEVSFDKIIEAIHVVQDEMGITGTTSEEASKTISGSIASMKASWQNLVGALANDEADLEWFINNFVESVDTAARNILPRIETALSGAGTLVTKLSPIISEALPELVSNVLPNLLQAGMDLLNAIIQGIVDSIPSLVEQAPVILENFFDALSDSASLIWDAGKELISQFGTGISENGPEIIGSVMDDIQKFLMTKFRVGYDTFAAAEETLQTAWAVISGIFDSIKGAIDTVATAVSDSGVTWEDVWNGISDALTVAGGLIESAITLIGDAIGWLVTQATTDGTLINLVWTNIQTAIETAVSFIQGIINTFIAVFNGDWSAAWETAKSTISGVFDGISEIFNNQTEYWGEKVSSALDSIKGWFDEKLTAAKETVTGIFDSIKSTIQEKIEEAKDKVRAAIDAIKGFFNFTFTWPHIPLPHFSITPSGWKIGDLLKGTIPSLGISWYAKAMDNAMILNGATIFGAYGNTLLGGGEAGPEVVSGADTLMNMIRQATSYGQERMVALMGEMLDLMAEYFPEIIQGMDRDMVLDDGTLVGKLTPGIDAELGKIYRRKNR